MRMYVRLVGVAGLALTLCGCSRGDNKTASMPIDFVSSALAAPASTDSARAASANAKNSLKAMSNYMASQKAISFDYDSQLEVVSKQNQKLGLASSGAITLNRPDKVRVTRHGGFANVEFVFDGTTVKMLGKDANLYSQLDSPGTIDQLVDVLRDKYKRPVPGADLLMSNVYDQLMPEVVDAKDLGSGVINGVECDHFAFRTKDVDWQMWVAQGPRPYPCRYVITSPHVNGSPQYTIDVRSWKTGQDVAADRFTLDIPAGAKKLNPGEIKDYDELPAIFTIVKESRGN
jgi:hypothetical protein